jgi:hypothetical protein
MLGICKTRDTKAGFAPMAGLRGGTLGHRGQSIETRKRVPAAQGDASSPTTPFDWIWQRFQELVFSLQCMDNHQRRHIRSIYT